MLVKAAKLCETGGREHNEDFVIWDSDGKMSVAVVTDGLGGHGSGDIASQNVAQAVSQHLMKRGDITDGSITASLVSAQDILLECQAKSAGMKNMRTTVVVFVSDGAYATWAHMGDSRLYHFSSNKVKYITPDHSVAYLSYQEGDISFDEISSSPDQNKLLRAMGDAERFKPSINQKPVRLSKKDAFLLCTDGFWEYVTPRDMELCLKKALRPRMWLYYMERILLKKIPAGNDNYSAIGLFVEDDSDGRKR